MIRNLEKIKFTVLSLICLLLFTANSYAQDIPAGLPGTYESTPLSNPGITIDSILPNKESQFSFNQNSNIENLTNSAQIVGGSNLITQAQANQIAGYLNQGNVTLTNIFSKTSGDGKTSANFHAAADGQGRTITVFRVQYNGQQYLIGGYNPQSWSSIGNYNYTPNDADRTAFLFNLTSDFVQRQKLSNNPSCGNCGYYQTYNISSYGPTFGGGHDIWVDNSLQAGYAYNWGYGNAVYSNNILNIGNPYTGYPNLQILGFEVFTVTEGCSNPNVLIIYDTNNSNTQALKTALENAGMTVTLSQTSETGYNGTNPSPANFDAVIHMNGSTPYNDMPVAGQQALVSYVQNGGAYIGGAWNTYEIGDGRMQQMRNLVLLTNYVGAVEPLTLTDAAGQSAHPILANISSPLTISGQVSFDRGTPFPFVSQPVITLMNSQYNAPILAVRDFGQGRVVHFGIAPNWINGDTTLSNTNIQQIYIDSIKWSANGCTVTNTAPTAVADSYLTDEDTALNVPANGVLGNDSDNENDPLTAVLVSAPANAASFTLNSDGSFNYMPNADFNGSDSFAYKANDGQADSNTVTVSITVNLVNDAPILSNVPANAVIDEEVLYSFTASAMDVDSANLQFSLINAPAGASIDANTGAFSWTPTEAQGPGIYNFTVRVSDGILNTDANISVEVIEVNIAPTLSDVPSAATIDELVQYTFTASASDPDIPIQTLTFSLVGAPSGASINSSTGVFTWTPTEAQGGNPNTEYTFTVRVTDDGMPALSDEETITVTVNEVNVAPVLSAISSQTGYWGNVFSFTAMATDADIPANTLSFSLIGAPMGASINSSTGAFAWTPTSAQIGSHTFTVRVTDNGTPNLYDEKSVTINVGKRPTALVYTGDANEQYSDQQALSATLTDNGGGAMQGLPVSGKSVGFVIGSQNASGSTNASGVASANLILTQDPAPVYMVNSSFAGDSLYLVSSDSDAFDITQEDARAYYTGTLFVNTACATCGNGTVTLSATVKDITAETGDPAYDALAGDIRNATVSFINRDNNTVIATVPVGLVSAGDTKVGTATYNWNVNIGSSDSDDFTIGILVNNYYTRDSSDDNVVVTVSKPIGTNFITGGGYLVMSNSMGTYAGAFGTKSNFGFNVKYNKSGKSLQGRVNVIVRNGGRVYQIKGNSMNTLSVNNANPNDRKAVYTGKANITDITDPYNPVPLGGNATFQMEMSDKGEPGSADTIGITVWDNGGGLLFSSRWNGTRTVEQILGGGNLVVR